MATPSEQIRAYAAAIKAVFLTPVGTLRQSPYRLRQGFDDNFQRGGNPEGAWPPHAPTTVARYGPHPLLDLSGAMRAAATQSGARGAVEKIGDRGLDLSIDLSVIPYARRQNLGDIGGRPIPQREFHLVDTVAVDDCEQFIATDVMERL